jgi:hypothetical protein
MGLQVTLNKDVFIVRFDDVSTAVHIRVREWAKDREGIRGRWS